MCYGTASTQTNKQAATTWLASASTLHAITPRDRRGLQEGSLLTVHGLCLSRTQASSPKAKGRTVASVLRSRTNEDAILGRCLHLTVFVPPA